MDADGDDDTVDCPAGLADHVDMAVRDRIEASGIKSRSR
jgi:hypothetical protein